MAADPRDRHDTVLERLTQRLEHRTRELRELVEEQDASVGQCSRMSPRNSAEVIQANAYTRQLSFAQETSGERVASWA